MKKDFTKDLLLEQLRKVPIIQVACEKVGISRGSYYQWTREDAGFAAQCVEAMIQGRDHCNDLTENQLLALVGEKRMAAISLWLKFNNPRYGAGVPGEPPPLPLAALDPDDPGQQKIQALTQQYEKDLREAIVEKIHGRKN